MTHTTGDTVEAPLLPPGRGRRLAPFAAITALGVALAWPAAAARGYWFGAAALAGVLGLACLLLPWRRWPVAWQAAPALAAFAVAGLVRLAGGGAVFVALALLPVLWLTLYHSGRLLRAGLILLAALLIAGYDEPGPDYVARIAVAFALACLVAVAGSQLAAQVRRQARGMSAARATARAKSEFLDAVLQTVGCLVAVVDREGRVTLVNRRWEELLGWTAAETAGRPFWEFGLAPHRVPGAQAALAGIADDAAPRLYESDWTARDGRRLRLSWTISALRSRDGTVSHLIGSGLDVTDQRQSGRIVRGVLAAATEQAIFAADPTGTITLFNVGAERLLGYRAEEVVGRLHAAALHLPGEIAARAAEQGVDPAEVIVGAARAGAGTTQEWTLVRSDGGEVPVSLSITGIRDEEQTLVGFLAVARDISTERRAAVAGAAALERERRAARHLRDLDRVRTDFVATVSHELRTPLANIVGNTEMLLDGDGGPLGDPARRMLSTIDRNTRRLRDLVEDLLLLSRIDADGVRLRPAAVDLRQLLERAAAEVGDQAAGPARITLAVPPGLTLTADAAQLGRVFVNVLGNAVKFSAPGDPVHVRATTGADGVTVEVTDRGIGIPADEMPYVCDRFYRSSRSQTREIAGSGLGLTICKSIVEGHGGRIALTSAAVGTTVTITLPRGIAGGSRAAVRDRDPVTSDSG